MAHERILMEIEADTVAAELAHHREAARLRMSVHGCAHVAQEAPRPHGVQTRLQRLLRLFHQAPTVLGHLA